MFDVIDMLTKDGKLTDASAGRIRAEMAGGKSLDDALREDGNLAEDAMLKSLATLLEMPYMELETVNPSKEFLAQFPARILLERHMIPLAEDDGVTTVATNRVFDQTGLDELRLVTGREFRPVLATSQEIDRCIKRTLGIGADTLQTMLNEDGVEVLKDEDDGEIDLSKAAEDATIIRFVNQIMQEALDSRATDVHVEPFEHELRIRYRIDGILVEANIPASIRRYHAAIVSRLKILAHLDIAEKRVPQDGRIRLKVGGREIDLRVSVIPMIHGEAVVMRILDRSEMAFGLDRLQMDGETQKEFLRVLDLPHGIILVTGPTGSGKTSTLYAGLNKINDTERKIITIEDPVEYNLKGINQIQVNTKAGLTFGGGLRAILRHDPDVVLIGEIRDRETAEIAVQASLTGHLVFSTLHTNDAPGAATRLIDMGVEPYLVSSSVEMVMAQRLVRVICKECKEVDTDSDMRALREEFGDEVPEVLYKGKGCRHCQNTGYRGRQAVFEMMPMTEEIQELILQRASAGAIRRKAVEQGMKSLREDAWRLVRAGRTTIPEIVSNTKDETLMLAHQHA
ncbi:MAG TPA: GspE/PulE family protein [Phycisphaerae bacterium]|jgi:general secretion pathway protein E/type IV pilus assembly protein PilB|nr:GspE/PulE family protein [Phycisphaerae bacterium]